MSRPYLLDTCAVVWITHNENLAVKAAKAIESCQAGDIHVSVATAWELGMLLARGRIRETRDAKRWYDGFMHDNRIVEQGLNADLLMASCILPHLNHKDPIDRILIATAREHDLTIITRDRAILDYGAAGHVRTLAC